MRHEHMARTRVQPWQTTDTPSRANGILHDAPEAFERIERVATMGGEAMETTRVLRVGEGRSEPVHPLEAAPVHDQHDLLLRMAEARHALRNIWAHILRLKVRHDVREDLRGPLWHGAHNGPQDAAADPAPGALRRPDLPLERCLPCDEAGAPRAGGQADSGAGGAPTRDGGGQNATRSSHLRSARCARHAAPDPLAQPGRPSPRRGRRAWERGGPWGDKSSAGFFKTPRRRARPWWSPV